MTLAEEMRAISTNKLLEEAESLNDVYEGILKKIREAASRGDRVVYWEADKYKAEGRFKTQVDPYLGRSLEAYRKINLIAAKCKSDGFYTSLTDGVTQDEVWYYGLTISW